MWFGEPHPFPERGSPTRLSASGQQSYKGWSCRNFTQYRFYPFVPQKRVHLNLDKRFSGWKVQSVPFPCTNFHSYIHVGNFTFYIHVVYDFISVFFFYFWRNSPTWARASSFTTFLDHTQRRNTACRTSLDEWSARRRDLYPTTHNVHNRQTSMPPVGFELII
jgi:hypothetical protein